MNLDELRQAIEYELDSIALVVSELAALLRDVDGRHPTVRERTAGAAFLAQFYNGIESILKDICRYSNVALPGSDNWHVELFSWFCTPAYRGLPVLFDEQLAADLAPYRRFRHVAFHAYGFQLDWDRMLEGIESVESVYARFTVVLDEFLNAEAGSSKP